MKKFFLILMLVSIVIGVGFFILKYLDTSFGINSAYIKRLLTYRNCYQTGYQKSEGDSELGIEGTLVNHATYYTVEQSGAPVSYRFTNIAPGSAVEKVMKERAGSLVDTKFVEHNFIIQNGVKIPDANFTRRGIGVHDSTLLSICFK